MEKYFFGGEASIKSSGKKKLRIILHFFHNLNTPKRCHTIQQYSIAIRVSYAETVAITPKPTVETTHPGGTIFFVLCATMHTSPESKLTNVHHTYIYCCASYIKFWALHEFSNVLTSKNLENVGSTIAEVPCSGLSTPTRILMQGKHDTVNFHPPPPPTKNKQTKMG